jgi:hypothetical protein
MRFYRVITITSLFPGHKNGQHDASLASQRHEYELHAPVNAMRVHERQLFVVLIRQPTVARSHYMSQLED